MGTHYLARGCRVLDVLSAGDNESVAWLDSPWKDKVLFLTGSDMKLTGTDLPQVKAKDFHMVDPNGKISDPIEAEFPGTKIVVSAPAFFSYPIDRYRAIGRMADEWQTRSEWEAIDLILMREAQEFLRAQASIQTYDAEQRFVDFFFKIKHHGFALCADSQRWQDIHKAIRDLADYTILKQFGVMPIPDEMNWLLSWIPPTNLYLRGQLEEGLRMLKPDQFFIVTIDRAIGQGTLDLCPWHIKRTAVKQKSLLKEFNITPEKLEITGPGPTSQFLPKDDMDLLMEEYVNALVDGDGPKVMELTIKVGEFLIDLEKRHDPAADLMRNKWRAFNQVKVDPSIAKKLQVSFTQPPTPPEPPSSGAAPKERKMKTTKAMHDRILANANKGMGIRESAEDITRMYGIPITYGSVKGWVRRHSRGQCPISWNCRAQPGPPPDRMKPALPPP